MNSKLYLVLIIFSLIGMTLVFIGTCKYGTGLCPDSVRYISTARNLLSGNGYVKYDGSLFMRWPPLFPTVLAILGLLGIEPLDGARFVNIAAFGLIIFAFGQLLWNYLRSKTFVVLGSLSVTLSIPLLYVSSKAWAEPLLVLFIILFMITLQRFLNEKGPVPFVLLIIFAALSCLQKYIGVAVVLTGFIIILILKKELSLLKKGLYALIFSVASLIPLIAWFIRNYILTMANALGGYQPANTFREQLLYMLSIFTGKRYPATHTFFEHTQYAFYTVISWIIPCLESFMLKAKDFILIMLFIAIVLFFLSFKSRSARKEVPVKRLLPLIIFSFIFTSILIISATLTDVSRPGHRLLSPLFPFFIIIIFVMIRSILMFLRETFKNKNLVNSIFLGIYMLWLICSTVVIFRSILVYIWTGAGGKNSTAWQESALIRWLRWNPPEGQVYTNKPEAIYILTGIPAKPPPTRGGLDFEQFKNSATLNQDNYIIWFYKTRRDWFNIKRGLSTIVNFRKKIAFPDGEIYIITPKNKQSI